MLSVLAEENEAIISKLQPHRQKLADFITTTTDEQSASAIWKARVFVASALYALGDPNELEVTVIFTLANQLLSFDVSGAFSTCITADSGDGGASTTTIPKDVEMDNENAPTTDNKVVQISAASAAEMRELLRVRVQAMVHCCELLSDICVGTPPSLDEALNKNGDMDIDEEDEALVDENVRPRLDAGIAKLLISSGLLERAMIVAKTFLPEREHAGDNTDWVVCDDSVMTS